MSIRKKYFATLFLLIIPIMLFVSCSPHYKPFSVEEGIAYFSFDYPNDMKLQSLDIFDDTHVYFCRRVVNDGWTDKVLTLSINKPPIRYKQNATDYKSLLEYDINQLSEAFKYSKILERSSITLDGINAELVVSTYDAKSLYAPLLDAAPKGAPSGDTEFWFQRTVYFDNEGLIWSISIESYEAAVEEAKADFEHVISTFKILE